MANDVYLQIDGIKGESADGGHVGWIEVSHVSWSVHQPRAGSVSTAGGHTAGRAELSEMSFVKVADLSSPNLLKHCAMGKTIPKAKFEFMRADGDGKPICYYAVELENVMIGGVNPATGETGLIKEHVFLAYSKMTWKYTKQGIRGGTEGNSSAGWDCAKNVCV